MEVLAVNEQYLLVAWSTPCAPAVLSLRPLQGGSEVTLPAMGACAVVSDSTRSSEVLEGLLWRAHEVTPQVGVLPCSHFIVQPDTDDPGLIMFIHGGPHVVSTTCFNHAITYLATATSCAVLVVNYRGSAGAGRCSLESLLGKVGTQDVDDCINCLHAALESGTLDLARVGVMGGSHGGFLTAHLIGQHPSVFAAAAVRNPVTNIATMTSGSDIPDWTFIESLGAGTYNFEAPRLADADILADMWSKSPCAHVDQVKTPTLIGLGMKDYRVPPSQGLEFYHALRARGVPTRLACYESDGHALDGATTNAEWWVDVARWFSEHLPPARSVRAANNCGVKRVNSFGV